ncbi:hypothetical protein DFH01_00325 [Falsiroseomonas bella]|uniref:DUF4760 domain-containing protein n=1 Tax=Falsiroseomonas bella TaxID=2184016 RepID=A0A317FHF5_9PROT|nr:hypothetical protein [Falsiroseomonas bella]PWS37802.1 hypothetical protein DFH01_00325 [Falsiroseomonas bella]
MGAAFVLLICALLAVAGMLLLSAVVPEAGFSAAFRNGVAATDPVRTWAELAYFITGAALSAIALLALIFAKRQAEHSREQAGHAARQTAISARATENAAKAEQAQAYMQFFTSERPSIITAVKLAQTLERSWRALPDAQRAGTTLGQFIHQRMLQWESSADAPDRELYNEVIDALITLENLALLVRRGYLSMDDVYYFLEGPLDRLSDVLLHHVQARRARSPDGRECEHADWLLTRILTHVPHAPLLS